jgi:hypothetical protein
MGRGGRCSGVGGGVGLATRRGGVATVLVVVLDVRLFNCK